MDKGKGKRGGEPENLYQRENGIWYGRITVDGRDLRKSLKTRNRKEAERRREAWLKENSPYKGTVRHTFQEASVLWLEAGEWKPKTLEGYAKLLKGVEAHFGAMFWDQVNKAELQRFIAARRWRVPAPRRSIATSRSYRALPTTCASCRDGPTSTR
ncbi:hypothetical protein ACFSTI_24880 [Rhizorhabdus histidinilytica]